MSTLRKLPAVLFAITISSMAAVAKEIVVYQSAWENPGDAIGEEWTTDAEVMISSRGNRVFLGGINERGASFRVAQLPPHRILRLQFDLIIKGSWDGASEGEGPDSVKIELKDGRVVLNSSFRVFENDHDRQSFPWPAHFGEMADSGYGAAHFGTLGYIWAAPGDRKWKADGVFPMEIYLPHSTRDFGFSLTCSLKNDKYQEQWAGLDNVKVALLEEEVAFGDDQWEHLLKDLKGEDGMKAFVASNRLAGAPTRAQEFLRGPRKALDAARLDHLLEELVDEEFKVRQAAQKELEQLPPSALWRVQAARLAHDDPEAIALLKEVIEKIKAGQAEPAKDRDVWSERLERLLGPAKQ